MISSSGSFGTRAENRKSALSMGLVIVFLGLLLGINWIFAHGLIFWPIHLLQGISGLFAYMVIAAGILLLIGIIGD
jgi:hypothetical protein